MPARAWLSGSWLRWSWIKWLAFTACFWTVIALVFVVPKLGQVAAWRDVVLSAFAQWWAWGLLAPLIVALDERLPVASTRIALRIAANAILGGLFALVYPYVWSSLEAALGLARWREVFEARRLIVAWTGLFWR